MVLALCGGVRGACAGHGAACSMPSTLDPSSGQPRYVLTASARCRPFPEADLPFVSSPAKNKSLLFARFSYIDYICICKDVVVNSADNEIRSKAVPFWKALPSQREQYLVAVYVA